MRNAFYIMLKTLFALEIFIFSFWILRYIEKRLDKKAMVNFKIHDVKNWATSNYNTYTAQYIKK